jgi:cytochrome P450
MSISSSKELAAPPFTKKIHDARMTSSIFTKKMVAHRMSSKPDQIDFLSYALNHRSDKEFMTPEEIEATSTILILGGSETSATLLSGAVYYLLKHPHTMQKVVGEIRGDVR